MTTIEEKLEHECSKPLVFYLELLRQNIAARPLTQEDLARMSGIPRSRLGRYERTREVPRLLEDLVALSYTLGLPHVEALMAPEVREQILEQVDQHRERCGYPPLRPPGTSAVTPRP